ncbi:MAG: Mth938-like domain-containing protein [Gammaproteobacteria bacterium]
MRESYQCGGTLDLPQRNARSSSTGIFERTRYRYGMKLTDELTPGANTVRSYGPGEIRVGDIVLTRSCLITATELVTDWRPTSVDDLEISDLDPILALEPEIVVLGVGERQRFPRMEWTAALLQRGVGCEVMITGAACRTYNVLVSEDRRVVAAFLLACRP